MVLPSQITAGIWFYDAVTELPIPNQWVRVYKVNDMTTSFSKTAVSGRISQMVTAALSGRWEFTVDGYQLGIIENVHREQNSYSVSLWPLGYVPETGEPYVWPHEEVYTPPEWDIPALPPAVIPSPPPPVPEAWPDAYIPPDDTIDTADDTIDTAEYRIEITFAQWAHGGLDRVAAALTSIAAALTGISISGVQVGIAYIIAGPDLPDDTITAGVPLFITGGGLTSLPKVVAWLKPLLKPALAFILALGGVITGWKVIDVVSQHEENAAQDQKTELGKWLLENGYTPDQVDAILHAIYTPDKGVADLVIPVTLVLAAAYILGEVVKK